MTPSASQSGGEATTGELPPTVSTAGRWTIHEFDVVPSTNLVAASLPAWHAVRAARQTAGRGRFQRSWISDQGGLWLSAVVPMAAKSPWARILPLAAGLAACDTLGVLGVTGLRLRWPNDVLVGNRKLAGLLLDQMVPGLAVIGIGINVSNRPEEREASLRDQVTRLSDLVDTPPALSDLTRSVLNALEAVWVQVQSGGEEEVLPRINSLWIPRSRVRLELDEGAVDGQFDGVDAAGRLRLSAAGGATRFFEPHEVRLLRETN